MNAPKSNLMEIIQQACKQFDGKLEMAFVRGKVGSGLQKREALIFLAGPVLTLDNIRKFRMDILEALEAKEFQLRGKPLDGTAEIYH